MSGQMTDERRKRVQRLKKLIILLLILAILLPIILCIILFVRMQGMQKQIDELHQIVCENRSEFIDSDTRDNETMVQQPETATQTETVSNVYAGSDLKKDEAEILTEECRRVYLTFDDGPSCYTDDILDILNQYDVKATFFVVGKTDEESLRLYQRIADEGHTLGLHSYSHRYHDIYENVDTYAEDLSKLQELLYDTTGILSRYTRFPGGSSNKVSTVDMRELAQYLKDQGIEYFDWNISSGDASTGYISAQTIVDNVMKDIEKHDNAIVLMHDAAYKKTTVEALPIIIERILDLPDTCILAIDDETVPVQHIELTE